MRIVGAAPQEQAVPSLRLRRLRAASEVLWDELGTGPALPPRAVPLPPPRPHRGKVLPAPGCCGGVPAPGQHPCTPAFDALRSRCGLRHSLPYPEQGAVLHPSFAAWPWAVNGGRARAGSTDRQLVGRALPVWALGRPGSQLVPALMWSPSGSAQCNPGQPADWGRSEARVIDCLVLFLQGCPGPFEFTSEVPREQGGDGSVHPDCRDGAGGVQAPAGGSRSGDQGCCCPPGRWLRWFEHSVPQFPHHHCPLGRCWCLWMTGVP